MSSWISRFVVFLLLPLLLCNFGKSQLHVNYYNQSCPKAEEIIKQEVISLYQKHANTAISWLRNLFHDCMVMSCDASLLLERKGKNGVISEKGSLRSFGMRNFKYINQIKQALETKCPNTVSCADIIALSARDAIFLLGGPEIEMRTGRKDSKQSYEGIVEESIPNHNDSLSLLLSRFQSLGIDIEATVAILGAHSVGRVHCINIVNRLYPTADPSLDPNQAEYLKRRCPTQNPNPKAVQYAKNDRETPMVLDNNYYKNILGHRALLLVDQQMGSSPITLPYVQDMASNNSYFLHQFGRAVLLLSENNPLVVVDDQAEIRKDCRYVN